MKLINTNIFNNKYEIFENNKRHQYGDSQCGVFCLNFITSYLNNKKVEDIISDQKLMNDISINKTRKNFFRPKSKIDYLINDYYY